MSSKMLSWSSDLSKMVVQGQLSGVYAYVTRLIVKPKGEAGGNGLVGIMSIPEVQRRFHASKVVL